MAPEYPNSFDTPAFPAGQRIAVSRVFGIGILSAFLLIVCLCGLLLWGVRSLRLDPFVISVDQSTGSWNVIGRSTWRGRPVAATDGMQQAVVGNFFQNWFFISDNFADNDAVWRKCPTEQCTGAEGLTYGNRECAISCMADGKLYDRFVEQVMENYHLRSAAGETWMVMTDTMQITPVGNQDTQNGGMWRVNASVWSNINAVFDVVAFVRVARLPGRYDMTMGYHVTDFNAYRMN